MQPRQELPEAAFFLGKKIGMKKAGRAAFEPLISTGKIFLQLRRKLY
ncbi:hypothetical protein [Paenibacillus chitinolyticus]|nr:hypothetical protein [Paenibacillus chitinolyticus]